MFHTLQVLALVSRGSGDGACTCACARVAGQAASAEGHLSRHPTDLLSGIHHRWRQRAARLVLAAPADDSDADHNFTVLADPRRLSRAGSDARSVLVRSPSSEQFLAVGFPPAGRWRSLLSR